MIKLKAIKMTSGQSLPSLVVGNDHSHLIVQSKDGDNPRRISSIYPLQKRNKRRSYVHAEHKAHRLSDTKGKVHHPPCISQAKHEVSRLLLKRKAEF